MNVKTKTAGIAVLLNTAFTFLKLLLYFLTGSLAVLADAWHSLSDIASSVVLLFAFVQDGGRKTGTSEPANTPAEPERVSNEVYISLAIGMVLLSAAGAIFHKGSLELPCRLVRTVPAGLFFIFFAFCSYALSRFEARVGQAENSIGLLADSAHSKADMLAALLTGFSLILHSLGFNLDKPVAYLIATLILCTAIETLINGTSAILHNDNSRVHRHRLQDWLVLALKPSTGSMLLTRLAKNSETGRLASRILRQFPKWAACLAVILILTPLITSSYFVLDPSQDAIVKRLGRPMQVDTPIGPGLHFKLPNPIDEVMIADTRAIHTIRVGPVSPATAGALLWTRQHGAEEPFLSADNSFFYPYAGINYTITNLHAYLFNQQDPETLIQQTASRIMTRKFLGRTFYELATRQRAELEAQIASELQSQMNDMPCGVRISDVFLRDIHPPIPIAPAFEQVIAAFQKKQQVINEAYGYRNKSIPEARGDAEQQKAAAHAYASRIDGEAVGNTGRRLLQLEAWQQAPRILRKNQLFQTLKTALAGRSLVLIDPAAGTPDLWMNEAGFTSLPGSSADSAFESSWQGFGPSGRPDIMYEEEDQ